LREIHENILSPIGLYSVSKIDDKECLGKICLPYPEIARKLSKTKIDKSYISTFKYRVGEERAKSSWIYRGKIWSPYQHHLIFFEGIDKQYIDVYHHREPNALIHRFVV
jgi:hypothetical protein